MNVKKFDKFFQVMMKHYRCNSATQRRFSMLVLAPTSEVHELIFRNLSTDVYIFTIKFCKHILLKFVIYLFMFHYNKILKYFT